MCTSPESFKWLAVSFSYKAFLQLGAVFMAFTTRKVKIKGLNDTLELYLMIYINTMIIIALTILEFAPRSNHHLYVALFGLAMFAEGTLFLGSTFIPKVSYLYS